VGAYALTWQILIRDHLIWQINEKAARDQSYCKRLKPFRELA
jgi:hypothetical protein